MQLIGFLFAYPLFFLSLSDLNLQFGGNFWRTLGNAPKLCRGEMVVAYVASDCTIQALYTFYIW